MRLITILFLTVLMVVGCKSKQELVNATEDTTLDSKSTKSDRRQNRGERRVPPTVEEVFQMDSNNDGKLSATEVANSPLSRNFTTIDSNNDGFITIEEFNNAPKPSRKKGPKN